MASKRKITSEVKDSGEKLSTITSEVDKITLDEYLKRTKVHPGLVASFRVEARSDEGLLLPKTEQGWKMAFYDQSNRHY